MNSRPLFEILSTLRARIASLPERSDTVREAHAQALASRLPLVHRTVPADKPDTWQKILGSGRIRAGAPCTTREQRLGATQIAYFFLGHPAWPHGVVAFLLRQHADILARATFTPFDSGGVEKHMVPLDPAEPPLDEAARDTFLASHVGAGNDLPGFAGPFIAAHVREPASYVSYSRYQGPDWPIFHGFQSPSLDRRSWTIEVQSHADVSIEPAQERIEALIVAGKGIGLRLDDDIFDLCTEVETEDDVPRAVIDHILTRATEPGS